MIEVSVIKADARASNLETLTTGMVNAVYVRFSLSSHWQGLTKVAVFSNGSRTIDVLEQNWDTQDTCRIPHEVLEQPWRTVRVGLQGMDGDTVVLPAVMCSIGRVKPGTEPGNDPGTDPTLPVWAQLQQRVTHLEDAVENDCYTDITKLAVSSVTPNTTVRVRITGVTSLDGCPELRVYQCIRRRDKATYWRHPANWNTNASEGVSKLGYGLIANTEYACGQDDRERVYPAIPEWMPNNGYVYFEEQNLHTMSADGELLLTILGSYAQEESRSVSENQKWRVRKNFSEGMPWNGTMLGYRYNKGQLVVEPEESETVRFIFDAYLAGKGIAAIAKLLNEKGVRTRYGNSWGATSIPQILHNYAYTGNLLLQQTYREDCLTKRKCRNNGALPQYHVDNAHEVIISMETFTAVQEEMKRRAKKYAHPGSKKTAYPFTGLIVCGCCGAHYRRKVTATGVVWICSTYNSQGKAVCASKQIPESTLTELTADIPLSDLTAIRAENGNVLV